MAWAPLAITAGSAVLGAMGQQKQAAASEDAANFSAQQDDITAAQTLDAARQTAQKIRRAGNSTASTADAAYSASGVRVDVGTPTVVGKQIFQDSESDALATLLNGQRQSDALTTRAAQSRASGQNAATAGQIAGLSTVLSSVGRSYGKWGSA